MSCASCDYLISRATEEDCLDIFNLSNDSDVRRNSFNQEKICIDDHIKWFNAQINNRETFFFVIKSKLDEFIGYVRFNLKNKDCSSYVITIHLSNNFRGLGLGNRIIKETSLIMFNEFDAKIIFAYVKKDNVASLKSLLKSGYILDGDEVIKGVDSFKLFFLK